MSNGWIVAKPDTDEAFDVVARDPINGVWSTFQIKTIRVRHDRGGDLVVYARRGNGEPYAKSDADYIIGVLESREGAMPSVYMFENRGICEYWATEARAEKRWVSLPIVLDREMYETEVIECHTA